MPLLISVILMSTHDNFRSEAHHHLVDLDATTNHLMMLVVANEVSGSRWDEALARQKQTFDAWASIVAGAQIDPTP